MGFLLQGTGHVPLEGSHDAGNASLVQGPGKRLGHPEACHEVQFS